MYSPPEDTTFGEICPSGDVLVSIVSTSLTIFEILSNVLIMCAVTLKSVWDVVQGGRVVLMVVILEEI